MIPTCECRSPAAFLLELFHALEELKIRYCVLHGYQQLPDRLDSDLDLAIHQEDAQRLDALVGGMAGAGYAVLQCFRYAVGARYLVFAWDDGCGETAKAAVDFIWEHRRRGLLLARGDELVEARRRQGEFWIPSVRVEFSYLLAKKVFKGAVAPLQAECLRALANSTGQADLSEIKRWFGGPWSARLIDACRAGAIEPFISSENRALRRAALLTHPFRALASGLMEAARIARRWWKPTGLFVAVLGPDGSGKSTLLENLPSQLGVLFRRNRVIHLRPNVLMRWRKPVPSAKPHAQELRGWFASLAVLCATSMEWAAGYWFVVRPALARSGLVLFDRYIYDLLMDPRRYRYGGPWWALKAACAVAPRPDLILVLDAPEATVMSRKQEVDPAELSRQRAAYAEFAARHKKAFLIDAGQAVEQVSRSAEAVVMKALAARFKTNVLPVLTHPEIPHSLHVLKIQTGSAPRR